jgi:hypothetical protein
MKTVVNKSMLAGAFALCVASVGCVIDDTGRSRGQSNAPSASVPDSGNPVRRENASDTLNKNEPANPNDVHVKVEKQ